MSRRTHNSLKIIGQEIYTWYDVAKSLNAQKKLFAIRNPVKIYTEDIKSINEQKKLFAICGM